MGIGFLVTSTPWKRRMWARPTVQALAKELRRVYTLALGEPLLVDRLRVDESDSDGRVWAIWHPSEEGLNIELLPDGRLQAWAKTNTVGPGYHAFLVRLLERIASELSISWDWNVEDEGDESGFATSGDFGQLQNAMLDWLRAVSSHVSDAEPDVQSQVVCLPIDVPLPIAGPDTVLSPLGPRQRSWFRDVAQDVAMRHRDGPAFFPWWNETMDASFWRGAADVLAWSDLRWVPPADERERADMAFAQACYQRAGAADSAESRELADLLQSSADTDSPPRQAGIGYRRQLCTFPLLGAWTVQLPGHFRVEVMNDGGNLQLHDGRRAVYVSAMSVDGVDAASLIDKVHADEVEERWLHEWLHGAALWEHDEDGATRHLMAGMAVDGHLMLLTITVGAGDDDGAWARRVARSARHPEPKD